MELGQGVRPPWATVPGHVVAEIEQWPGGPVTAVLPVVAASRRSWAARLQTGAGSGFVKVGGPNVGADAPRYARAEARIRAALPDIPQLAPLRWSYDDGEWIALGFEDLRGTPPSLPWSERDVGPVLSAVAAVHEALTPAPLPVPGGTRPQGHRLLWLGILTGDEPGLDEWSRRHLATLQEVERYWPEGLVGDTLIHTDLRSDNVVIARAGSGGRRLASRLRRSGLVRPRVLRAVAGVSGGPRCADLLARQAPGRRRRLSASRQWGVAGHLTAQALRPPPPGLPTVRPFQARLRLPARAWAAELLGLHRPGTVPGMLGG